MIENESGDIVAVDNSNEVAQVEGQNPETGTAAPVETQEENNTDGEVKRKRPSGFHRKINKLEQQLAEKDARLADLEQKLKPQDELVEPNIDNFYSHDEYNRAVIRYETNNILKIQREKAQEEKELQEKIEKENQVKSHWEQKVDALGESYDDYEDVIGKYKNVNVRREIIQATAESDLGPQIRYYLAKNPEILNTINNENSSSLAIYKKIAEIEATLSKPSVNKVSKSSEPISPVKGTAKTAVKLDNLDTDSYIAQRYPHLYKK